MVKVEVREEGDGVRCVCVSVRLYERQGVFVVPVTERCSVKKTDLSGKGVGGQETKWVEKTDQLRISR